MPTDCALPSNRYKVVFTNDSNPRHTFIDVPDIEFARMKAQSMSKDIMEQRVFGDQDWSKWKFIVSAVGSNGAEKGTIEGPFIEN